MATTEFTLNVEGIPVELRAEDRWVSWTRAAPPKPGDKPRKLPIDPKTGKAASSVDPSTWGSFEQALEHTTSKALAGVGFMLEGSEYTGFDWDNCRDPATGVIDEAALADVTLLGSYAEVSPSERGLRAIAKGKLPPGGRKKKSVEMYDAGRYLTFTGQRIDGVPAGVEERQAQISHLHTKYFGKPNAQEHADEPEQEAPEIDLDDDELIHRAFLAKNGPKFRVLWEGRTDRYGSKSEADLALCALLAFWTRGDPSRIDRLFRRSGLYREKWDETHGDQTYGAMTIAKAAASSARGNGHSGKRSKRSVPYNLTDTGNAERLVDRFGANLRYCHPWKKWLVYGDGWWRTDEQGKPIACSKHVARGLLKEASECEDSKLRDALTEWSKRSEKAERRKAMVDLARSEPGIPILPDQLDRHPFLLNCANGTLDLNTFELRPHSRSDYLTKFCPTRYEPKAECPIWDRFLERILPDEEVRAYVQRRFGYALTGDVSEQVLGIDIGEGANGKSTLIRAIQDTLSMGYAIQIPSDLLLVKDHPNHPTEIADLFGVRLAIGIESPKGKTLDEALVKQLTGSDRIRARRMREDFWEFEPSHKLILVTNFLPKISIDSHAIARRLHIVRYEVTIPEEERDRKLLSKLRAEREGILAWMVRGCREWKEQGLSAPSQVLFQPTPVDTPRQPFEDFVDLYIVRQPGARTRASAIYTAFVAWCEHAGKAPCPQQEFGSYLGHKGFGKKKSDGVMVYTDLSLRGPDDPNREDQGREGPPSRLIALSAPHEEKNRESGPCPPYSSLSAGAEAEPACEKPHENGRDLAPCRCCGSTGYWHLRSGGPNSCGRCHPPPPSAQEIEWIDALASVNGNGAHA